MEQRRGHRFDLGDRTWQWQANCLGVDPDLFFPERGRPRGRPRRCAGAASCAIDCLEYALVNGEKFGIWGGLSERERRRIRRERTLASRGRRPRPDPRLWWRRAHPRPARRHQAARASHPPSGRVRRQAAPRWSVDGSEVELRPPLGRGRPSSTAAGRRPTSSARSTATSAGAPRRRPRPGRPRSGSTRFIDTWARPPTSRPSARTAGPRTAAATRRASSTPTPVGQPHVVGHQHRPGPDADRARGRVGHRRAGRRAPAPTNAGRRTSGSVRSGP